MTGTFATDARGFLVARKAQTRKYAINWKDGAEVRDYFSRCASRRPVEMLERARQMRSCLTPAEQKLWAEIAGCRLGVWFRRQVPIGRYIADFVAPSVWLVVEVDGEHHRRQGAADARRDRVMARLGYRVLRLPALLVERDLPEALGRIRAALAAA